MKIPAVLAALLAAPVAIAQDDVVRLATGEVIENAKVLSWTIRELKYRSGGGNQTVSTDKVDGIELGEFSDVYRRGIAGSDPDLMLTTAREQVKAKQDLMAQLGFINAARLYYRSGKEANGGQALEEMVEAFPEGGMVPELYRMKFESYMGRGESSGYRNAAIVGKKMQTDATTKAWPNGLAIEGEFYVTLAEAQERGTPADFQAAMRGIAQRAQGANPRLAARANVQLADSLRRENDLENARRLYEAVLEKPSSDVNSRAAAYLGIGMIQMEAGNAQDREPYKQALLNFLRVHLETKESWDSLQGEALANAMTAAGKWQGADYVLIAGRCKNILMNDFGHTRAAQLVRQR